MALKRGSSTGDAIPFWEHHGAIFETNASFHPYFEGHAKARKHIEVGTDHVFVSFLTIDKMYMPKALF